MTDTRASHPLLYSHIPRQPRRVCACSSCATDQRADYLIWIAQPPLAAYVALCRSCYVADSPERGLQDRLPTPP